MGRELWTVVQKAIPYDEKGGSFMASDGMMDQFREVAEAIIIVDKNKLLRPSLGTMSLENDFAPTLGEIEKKVNFALHTLPNYMIVKYNRYVGSFSLSCQKCNSRQTVQMRLM